MQEYLLQRAPVRATRKPGTGTEAQKKALGLMPAVSEDDRRAALGLPAAKSPVLPPPSRPSHAQRRR